MKMVGIKAALALGAILALQGAALAESGVTDKEVVIGACLPKSDPLYINTAPDIEIGLDVYLNYVNAKQGGVHGRKIKLVAHDPGAATEGLVECFDRLTKEGIFLFTNPVGPALTAKSVRLAEANKTPLVGSITSIEEMFTPIKRYVFGTGMTFSQLNRNHIDHLWKDAGMRKIAFIYQNDLLGNTNYSEIQAQLKEKYGGALVAASSYLLSGEDMDEAIKRIMDTNPDAMVMSGPPQSTQTILKKSRALGMDAVIVHASGAKMEEYPKLGAAAEGLIVAQRVPPISDTSRPSVALFHEQLKRYAPKTPPTFMGWNGFLSGQIIAEGLQRAGKDLTREKFIDALESLRNWDGGYGPEFKVAYGPNDHQAYDAAVYFIIRNGEWVLLKDWAALKKAKPSGAKR